MFGFSSQPMKNLSALILMYTCYKAWAAFSWEHNVLVLNKNSKWSHTLFGRKFKWKEKAVTKYKCGQQRQVRWGSLFSNEKRNDPKSTWSCDSSKPQSWVSRYKARWCFLEAFPGQLAQLHRKLIASCINISH